MPAGTTLSIAGIVAITMSKPRITIVGTGFIGGSIGLALKKAKVEAEIVGHDKDNGVAARAKKRGAVDTTKWNLVDACEGAGLIVLAIPLAGIKPTLDALNKYLEPGVVITDTAATKKPVIEWANDLPTGVSFVGGNPIPKATRAKGAGIDAADAELFQDATYCLVASPRAAPNAMDVMANFAALLGAKPYFVDAQEHDGIMSGIQHLPALLANALAAAVIQNPSWREAGKLASADFREATSLLAADARDAAQELIAHRTELLQWLDVFDARAQEMRGLLERGDTASLEKILEQIAAERAKWLAGNFGEAPAVDLSEAQFSAQRLFLGRLGTRGKKSN